MILHNTKYKNTKASYKKTNKEKAIINSSVVVDKAKDMDNHNEQINRLREKLNSMNQNQSDADNQANNITKKIEIPHSTHYGDVAVRVMSDAEIEHDKQKKVIEEEKYNDNKAKESVNTEGQLSQAQNIINQDITNVKTMLEQKVDE